MLSERYESTKVDKSRERGGQMEEKKDPSNGWCSEWDPHEKGLGMKDRRLRLEEPTLVRRLLLKVAEKNFKKVLQFRIMSLPNN